MKKYLIIAAAVLCAIIAVMWHINRHELEQPYMMAERFFRAMPDEQTTGGRENPDVYLQSLDIAVKVTGNIASTRYTMVFKNNTNRVLEGALTFPLPDGVSATHYAIDIDGRMREAVPVEKAHGTKAFEEIKARRVDPGLLEKIDGGSFRTRVYPIQPKGSRTVSVGWEQELTRENGMAHYRLPITCPDSLEKFSLTATVLNSTEKPTVPKSENDIRFNADGGNYTASLARKKYRPPRELAFAMPAPADTTRALTRQEQGNFYFLAEARPNIEPRETQWADELAVIWDVSLSGSRRGLKRDMEILNIIFAKKKNANVHLYFLNNIFIKKGEYKVADGKWDALKNVLDTAVFDGGTDFSQINLNDITGHEILFFSDGISTLGDADFLKIVSAADFLKTNRPFNRPIHTFASSAKADLGVMKSIAWKTKGKFVNVNALSAEQLKKELLYETPLFLGAEHGKAVREVYPSIAAPVYGNISVAGISDTSLAELTLLFGYRYGYSLFVEKRVKVILDAENAAGAGNIHKIWAQKKAAELDSDYEKNRAVLAELGRQFGIVTRNTSLIVLETVEDYIKYGIEPPASERELLAAYRQRGGASVIKAVPAGGGVTSGGDEGAADNSVRNEKRLTPAESRGVSANHGGGDPRARVTQMGVLGIVSGQMKGKSVASADKFGKGGFASDIDAILSGIGGLRAGGGGYREPVPVPLSPDFVKRGKTTGVRNRESIQNELRRDKAGRLYKVYGERSRYIPGIEGAVTVKFAILASGKVISAYVVESAINDSVLENNVVRVIKSWEFAGIGTPSDTTVVTYPFVFKNPPWTREYPYGAKPVSLTLDGAAAAAENLKRWRNIDYAALAKLKPPARDSIFSEKGDFIVGETAGAKGGRVIITSLTPPVYIKALTGNTADDYRTYLRLRDDYVNSPAYYFNMADWFYKRGDRETARRVLTSAADLEFEFENAALPFRARTFIAGAPDLELERASLYRLLGYRFKEYGEYALEKFVCGEVVRRLPAEPQSYRDYALALADNGEFQAALDSLYSLLIRAYPRDIQNNADGMAEVVVAEINHLIAKNPRLNTSKIDRRLLVSAPVDVRVVINGNIDRPSIGLHVIDPDGEECNRFRGITRAGGRMTLGAAGGYGPRQYLLKNGVKGKYKVYVSYYWDYYFPTAGERDGAPTIMAEIYTNYAGEAEQRKTVTLQVSDVKRESGIVQVAEFEF